MLGIGIDTGGTCTDAVVYDMKEKEVLAWAKTQTTKRNLKIGIARVLEKLPEHLLGRCGRIALSTTLATNACVENLGGRGKLIFIGVNETVFDRTYRSYGYSSKENVLFIDCRILPSPEKTEEPDWEQVRAKLPDFLMDCDCVSIVQLYSGEHLGAFEKKAAALVKELADIPIVMGHTLFPDRNAIRRGTGALLNARLIPVICAFMEAVRQVFTKRGLSLPTVIIRSDGSQMSMDFALKRPVETLLCGPAASVIGASVLTSEKNALIVDMGGTTTDISIIKNGQIRRSEDGIQVGGWKTFVKGLYVDTFGLGGDTAIHFDFDGKVYLEDYRVIPLCSLAASCPEILEELKLLDESERRHPCNLHEYFCLQKEKENVTRYTKQEQALLSALADRPLSMEQAAAAMGTDVYTMDTGRLEKEGIIIRAGLTPTDVMHIRGDYVGYCKETSLFAARFVARSSGLGYVHPLCEHVYHLVTKRLYCNLVRILLQTECPAFAGKKPDDQLQQLIDYSYALETGRLHENINKKETAEIYFWEEEENKNRLITSLFTTKASLIGVGAPAHVFLPRAARLLHTSVIIPEFAQVANAVGAIAGQIHATLDVFIRPVRDKDTFEVLSGEERKPFETYEEAFAFARAQGEQEVREKIRRQGASGKTEISFELKRESADMRYGDVWFGDVLHFFAVGNFL